VSSNAAAELPDLIHKLLARHADQIVIHRLLRALGLPLGVYGSSELSSY
jgi:hypothetical protein